MKFVTFLASLVFVLCRVSIDSLSEDANPGKFRLLRKSSFDPSTIVRIDSGSISQATGHSQIDHSINPNSIGLIASPPIDAHYPYRFDENQAERSDNFHTYKNAMRSLLSNKLNSNIRKSNFTGPKEKFSHDSTAADQPLSFQRQLAYKKLQAPKSCRCQLQKMQRIVNGQTAEPNQIPWQVGCHVQRILS